MSTAFKRMIEALYAAPAVLLSLTALFWGGNAVAGRLAVDEVSPSLLTFLRWGLVLLVLWPIYGGQIREAWPELRPQLTKIVLMAFLGFTAFNVLFYYGARYTSAINLGILQGSIPVLVLAGAFLVHGTRTRPIQLAGVLLTLIGVVVVATRGEVARIVDLELNRGDAAMLAACVFYAFFTVALRNRPRMSGAAFFTLLAAIAAATSLPMVAVEALNAGLSLPTARGWAVIAYVAIFPSCLAQLFFLRGVDLIGPSRAGVFVNLVPVFAAGLGVGLIGEPFSAFHAVALVLVFGGIWLAQRATPVAPRGT